jgi:uncharacterized membrane protein
MKDETGESPGGRMLKYLALAVVSILSFTVLMYVVYDTQPETVLRVVLGLLYMMFLPGFLLSGVMFPGNGEIDSVERIGLSFGLSIPLTLTTVLAMDQLLGIPLTSETIIRYMGWLMAAMVVLIAARVLVRRLGK